jgi:hypothetical protein
VVELLGETTDLRGVSSLALPLTSPSVLAREAVGLEGGGLEITQARWYQRRADAPREQKMLTPSILRLAVVRWAS